MASLSGEVYFSFIKNSAASIKSLKVFLFFNPLPSFFHFNPFSPPPLISAKAKTLGVVINPRYGVWDNEAGDVVAADVTGDAVKPSAK